MKSASGDSLCSTRVYQVFSKQGPNIVQMLHFVRTQLVSMETIMLSQAECCDFKCEINKKSMGTSNQLKLSIFALY